ncbi:MAG: hypothetical protein D6808_07875 [Candidatus Dadabacteria bacterium]|nr:MAG: hypothetical protein D6808_07875 [Candidatus Dadabacteria bacterium]
MQQHSETCNIHAYVKTDLDSYITSRFPKNSPVRLAVIPFTVPANFTGYGAGRKNLGTELAAAMQRRILEKELVPIAEVFNREYWPGKEGEFFSGNFGALAQAREAGYDLVLVGLVDNLSSLNAITVYTKIIDVDAGVTLWYGKATAQASITENYDRRSRNPLKYIVNVRTRPDLLYFSDIIDEVVNCSTDEIASIED